MELLTITCKNILSEDLNAFKSQLSAFNYTDILESDDNIYKLTQDILLKKYGNSQVRYETAENFLNALSLRFYNIAPVYSKKFKIIDDALEVENEKFLNDIKNFTEDKTNNISSSQTENRKDAETPTSVKAETNFIDKYTNSASKTETEGESEETGNIEHTEINADKIIEKIDNLQRFKNRLFEEYAREFNDLFIQFI